MPSTRKIGSHKTTVCHHTNGDIVVTYHSTAVVTATTDKIILNTGGYFSYTTKMRMNQAANELSLPYRVSQDKGTWSAWHFEQQKTYPFKGNICEIPRS